MTNADCLCKTVPRQFKVSDRVGIKSISRCGCRRFSSLAPFSGEKNWVFFFLFGDDVFRCGRKEVERVGDLRSVRKLGKGLYVMW